MTSEIKTGESLYNRYRPADFSELVGQDHVISVIQEQIRTNTLPQCLILYGPAGCGKTSLARLIAKALNDSEYGLIEKDSAFESSKDNIRELQSTIYNKPFIGSNKTYLFDEAHQISKASFSSLLKLTEEPPEHVRFIFVTTDFDKILDTIKSRSQSHCLHRLNNTVIHTRLQHIIKSEKFDITPALMSLIIDSASGSLRNAIVNLSTVVASYLSGNTELDIAKTLGILGSKRLADFTSNYIFEDFKQLDSSIEMFYPENTDLSKAIYSLQQYIMDCRYSIIVPELRDSVRSDVSGFFDLIDAKILSTPKVDKTKALTSVGRNLDKLYDLTVELENNLFKTSNKEAALKRFVIKLAQSWS